NVATRAPSWYHRNRDDVPGCFDAKVQRPVGDDSVIAGLLGFERKPGNVWRNEGAVKVRQALAKHVAGDLGKVDLGARTRRFPYRRLPTLELLRRVLAQQRHDFHDPYTPSMQSRMGGLEHPPK